MPDIYGNISPIQDAPEVASTDNIRPADLSVNMPKIDFYKTQDAIAQGEGGNDLLKLMASVNKDTSSQAWAKSSIYTNPVINTPFKFTTRYLDPNMGWDATDKDLEVKYGAAQGVMSRVFNRLVKTGATAAVSFAEQLNSTINLLSGNDNVTNEGVTKGNEWLERLDQEVLPNYQTAYQRDHPLLSYLPNPFEMKSFLDNVGNITQNLGYTIGAMAGAAILDIPVAALTEGLGEIPLVAAQSAKIFSGIGKLARVIAGSAEEYNAYKSAINSGDDILKALALASNIKKGTNTVRFLNSAVLSAYGESVMEANNIYRETKKGLQDQFSDSFGNYTGDENVSARIEEAAKNAGQVGLKGNMAFLTVSNMFGLGSILRPGAAAIKATEAALSKEVAIKMAANNINTFELVASKATGLKSLFKAGSRLLLENSKEAVEEGYQYGLETGSSYYYTRKFNDKSNNDVNALSDSIHHGLSQVFTTTEGQESMLMGLVGGMVQAGAQGFIQNRQGIKSGAALGNSMVSMLNTATVTGLFNTARNEAVTSADIVRQMQDAARTGDMFRYKNLQHQALFNLVDTGVRANKFDARIEQLEALKQLSKENFETLFNIELNENNKGTVSNFVDSLIVKAKEIKTDIDRVNTVFGTNPYSKKEAINHLAFENYKTELSLALSEQRDRLRRVRQLNSYLYSTLPSASNDDIIALGSEDGVTDSIKKYTQQIQDLKVAENNVAGGNTFLMEGFRKQREFLEEQVEDLKSNLKSYNPDMYIQTLTKLYNYHANGNSLTGEHDLDEMTTLSVFNNTRDISELKSNTDRIKRYYRELTSKNGFKNFAEDFGRRVMDYQDRVRIDEDGKMKVLSDEELTQEGKTPEEDNKDYTENVLGVKNLAEGEDKVEKEDRELLAKLLDDGEAAEEGKETLADRIRNGTEPITSEMKETAKARLRSEFTAPTADTVDTVETPDNSTKAEVRKAKIKKAAEKKGVAIVDEDEEDEQNINDIMEADAKDKATVNPVTAATATATTTATPAVEEVPQEIISHPIVRFWNKFIFSPLKEFNRIFSFDNTKTDVKYKSNLDRLVLNNMSPEKLHANVISKMRLEVVKSTQGKTPDQRNLMVYFQKGVKKFYDNLYRSGYGVDVNVMVGDAQVGVMQPPSSLQFKRGDEFLTLDKLADAAEYSAVTLNPANTFDQFKKDWQEYKDAYEEATKGYKAGEMLHVNNETTLKIFRPVVSYGNLDISSKEAHSTLISDLKYRGKGDAILSFPVELNEETGKYERTSKPTILNEEQLSPEQVAETLEYVGKNLDRIHAQDVRYIYLMRMPDGQFSNQSVIVARPADETGVNLDGYLDQIKAALNNNDSDSYFALNAALGDSVYIAHNRRTANQPLRKTSARFSIKRGKTKAENAVVLTIYNKGLNHNKRIQFSMDEINNMSAMTDLISLANERITEAEKSDRYLMKIGLEITPESFKKNIPNDLDISVEDLETSLKLSVRPKVFANTSITMMPANGVAYTAPVETKGKKGRKPAAPKETGEGKTTGEGKSPAPVIKTGETVNEKKVGVANTKVKAIVEGKEVTIAQGVVTGENVVVNIVTSDGKGSLTASMTKAEIRKAVKVYEDTVSKQVAAIKIGDTYKIGDTEREGMVTNVADVNGKTQVTFKEKDGPSTEIESSDFLATHSIKEAEKAPSASTSTPTNAADKLDAKIAEDTVNKNLNKIINQLKAQGLLKTDC